MAVLKLVCLAFVCMVLASTAADATISCGMVVSKLTPCITYASSGKGPVPGSCCSGVKDLNNAARTTPDRQAACTCLKNLAGSIKSINFGVVAGIPGKCGVPVPYKISPNTDCKSVK